MRLKRKKIQNGVRKRADTSNKLKDCEIIKFIKWSYRISVKIIHLIVIRRYSGIDVRIFSSNSDRPAVCYEHMWKTTRVIIIIIYKWRGQLHCSAG